MTRIAVFLSALLILSAVEAPDEGVQILVPDKGKFELQWTTTSGKSPIKDIDFEPRIKYKSLKSFFPDRKLKVGEAWEVDPNAVRGLFRAFHQTGQGKLTATLESVQENHAQVTLSGEIEIKQDIVTGSMTGSGGDGNVMKIRTLEAKLEGKAIWDVSKGSLLDVHLESKEGTIYETGSIWGSVDDARKKPKGKKLKDVQFSITVKKNEGADKGSEGKKAEADSGDKKKE